MDNLTITILVPVLLILLTALIGSIISGGQEKRRIFNDEANKFRDSFKPEMEQLQSNNTELLTCDILSPSFGKHQTAITYFNQVLTTGKRKKLFRLWAEYSNIYDQNTRDYSNLFDHNISVYSGPYEPCIDHVEEDKIRNKCIDLITEFFKIAKPK